MKKIICALLSLVLLCSCSSAGNVKVVNRNISYKAHIFYFGKEIDLFCNIKENCAEYTVINGMADGFTAIVDGDGIKVGIEGLEKEMKTQDSAVFSVLYGVTSFFDGQNYKLNNDGGNFFLDGETSFGKFRYSLTPAGLPISLEFENGDFSAKFYDITLKKTK